MAVFNIRTALGKAGSSIANNSTKKFIKDAQGLVESILGSSDNTLIIGYRDPEQINFVTKGKNWFKSSFWEDQLSALANETNSDANNGVQVDGIFNFNGELSITLTKNPVQKNADINDHRIKQPKRLTLEVGVSNDVVRPDVLSVAKRFLGDIVNTYTGANLDDRRIQTFENFKQLMYDGLPFKIVTPHGIYENMLLTSIRPITREDNIGLFQAYLDFQEVILFDSVENEKTNPTRKGVTGVLKDRVNSLIKPFGINI